MVREQHARTRTAQPDTARRRDADETDPVRPVPTRGFEATARSSGFPGGVVGRARAAEGRGVGPGYAHKVEVSRAEAGSWGGREREEDGSSGTEADGGGVGVGAKEEEQGRAGVGGQQPVGAVREAVRGLRRFGFLRRLRDVVGQRPWIPCDMGLSLPKTCPMCGMSKSPSLKIWGHVMRMSLSLGGLGERNGCEQSTEESKLAINSWRNGKEGVQVIFKGVSGPREFVNRALPVIRRIVFFLLYFRTCIQMWKVTG